MNVNIHYKQRCSPIKQRFTRIARSRTEAVYKLYWKRQRLWVSIELLRSH